MQLSKLERAIYQWLVDWNEKSRPFVCEGQHLHSLQDRHQRLLVMGFLRHRCRHDHLPLAVHQRLRALCLHKLFRRSSGI